MQRLLSSVMPSGMDLGTRLAVQAGIALESRPQSSQGAIAGHAFRPEAETVGEGLYLSLRQSVAAALSDAAMSGGRLLSPRQQNPEQKQGTAPGSGAGSRQQILGKDRSELHAELHAGDRLKASESSEAGPSSSERGMKSPQEGSLRAGDLTASASTYSDQGSLQDTEEGSGGPGSGSSPRTKRRRGSGGSVLGTPRRINSRGTLPAGSGGISRMSLMQWLARPDRAVQPKESFWIFCEVSGSHHQSGFLQLFWSK